MTDETRDYAEEPVKTAIQTFATSRYVQTKKITTAMTAMMELDNEQLSGVIYGVVMVKHDKKSATAMLRMLLQEITSA